MPGPHNPRDHGTLTLPFLLYLRSCSCLPCNQPGPPHTFSDPGMPFIGRTLPFHSYHNPNPARTTGPHTHGDRRKEFLSILFLLTQWDTGGFRIVDCVLRTLVFRFHPVCECKRKYKRTFSNVDKEHEHLQKSTRSTK